MTTAIAWDDWLPRPQLGVVHALAEAHWQAKQEDDGPEFSWYSPKQRCHISRLAPARLEVAQAYVDNVVARLASLLGREAEGYEWWSNCGNDLGWHVDKDESVYRAEGRFRHPRWSTVLYTDVEITGGGGALILLAEPEQPPPYLHDLASHEIPHKHHAVSARTNRLVVFRRGLLHRIDPFTGRRTSLAMNVWDGTPREFERWRGSRFCHALP